MNMGFVHLISVNIRGLRNKEKRKMIYNWITNQKADICFLQETFLDTILDNSMKKEWSIETISSFGTNHSRGVTIVYKKNVDLKIINYIVADDGRKILINLEIKTYRKGTLL
jgi:exonuclease III